MLENIKKEKGIQQYLYSQPKISGDVPMYFNLLCYNEAVEEVYDVFGRQNTRTIMMRPENYDDPDTTLITVRSTREAMKSWAVFHADSIVVIEPDDLRNEVANAIKTAEYVYNKSGKPSRERAEGARSFDEFLHEYKLNSQIPVAYYGRGKDRDWEMIDISDYDLNGISCLQLNKCKVFCTDKDTVYPEIKSLSFGICVFDTRIFEHFPAMESLTISISAITDLSFLSKLKGLKELKLRYCENISDVSPLLELNDLRSFETDLQIIDDSITEKLHKQLPECKIKVVKVNDREYHGAIRTCFYIRDGRVVSRDVRYMTSYGWRDRENVQLLHDQIKALDNSAVPFEPGPKMNLVSLSLGGHKLKNVLLSSMVFENGGPYRDLLGANAGRLISDKRLENSGELTGYNYEGADFPAEPGSLFHDYIFIKAVRQLLTADEISSIKGYSHFTDREFYAPREKFTPARSAAIIKLLLDIYGEIPDMSPEEFGKFHREHVTA